MLPASFRLVHLVELVGQMPVPTPPAKHGRGRPRQYQCPIRSPEEDNSRTLASEASAQ